MRCYIGIYNLHMRAMGGGEKLTVVLAEHLSVNHNVTLFSSQPLDIPLLERFFGVDLSRVSVSLLTDPGPVLQVVERVRGYRLPAFSVHHFLQIKKLNLDVFINNSYASGLFCPAHKGIFMCMFPHSYANQDMRFAIADRIERRIARTDVTNSLDTYSTIASISQFSAGWVRKLWNRDSEIIYPPCDDIEPASSKRNLILNVGRFIADANDERNHKNQALLVEAFKRMVDLHRDGWELHFAGSVAGDENSIEYVQRLEREACGFPIFFHFNASRSELQNLYQSAFIYWHATGHGFDSDEHPAKQEHFGITTVEAMSAGAVPLVYGSGGQKEIVTQGVDGLFWTEMDDLISQTKALIDDRSFQQRLSREAISSSKRFGRKAFGERVDQLIAQLQFTESPDTQALSQIGILDN
jgi:glycosyltransferase involved in cell wall biosynthesis